MILHFRISRDGKPQAACSNRLASPAFAVYDLVSCLTCRRSPFYRALADERTRVLIGASVRPSPVHVKINRGGHTR